MPVQTRKADFPGPDAISKIYNQGIQDRIAIYEPEPKSSGELEPWLNSGFPVVVAIEDGEIIAFAASFPYGRRVCYRGIGEFSVYVHRARIGHGTGKISMKALVEESEKAGLWKLVSRVFVENTASRKLLKNIGFREVGIYEKHASLDGSWKDVVIVEYLIQSNMR